MKREIPLIGLVLVLALLLIIPIFQVISIHAFVCNISTVSNVGGCYVYITVTLSSHLTWFCCLYVREQGFFITENGVVGSLHVFETVHVGTYSNPYTWPCPDTYKSTTIICVVGYILVSGNLPTHYIKPLSYTGFGFVLPGYGHVAFYCLSHPPKSLYYLATPVKEYYISCFCSAPAWFGINVGEVMTSIIGFRVPLDDIFYYILSPSLFCGSIKVKSHYTSILHTCSGWGWWGTSYYVCYACLISTYTVRLSCSHWGQCWWWNICFTTSIPLTVTTLTYTVYFGTHKYTGNFCLIDTLLSGLPTITMSCSFVLPPYPCLYLHGSFHYTHYAIITSSGYIQACTYVPPWCPHYNLGTYICRHGMFGTFPINVGGGVLINYLPYCTEYILFFKLCETTSVIC